MHDSVDNTATTIAGVKVKDNGAEYFGGGGAGGGGGGSGVVGGTAVGTTGTTAGNGIIKTAGSAEHNDGPAKTVTLVGFDDLKSTPNLTPYKACE